MLLLTLFLATVVAAVALVVGAHALWTFVRDDGASLPSWQRTPPRSHHPDPFDPRSRIA
jgi:hypothetical protein